MSELQGCVYLVRDKSGDVLSDNIKIWRKKPEKLRIKDAVIWVTEDGANDLISLAPRGIVKDTYGVIPCNENEMVIAPQRTLRKIRR